MKIVDLDKRYNECLAKAKEYSSIVDWMTNDYGSYYQAWKYNWVDKIIDECGIKRLRVKKKFYTYENLLIIRKSYDSRKEWREKDAASYLAAGKNRWARKINDEVEETKIPSFDECLVEAKKYESNKDWRTNGLLYKFALKFKWNEQIIKIVGFKKGSLKKHWWYNL